MPATMRIATEEQVKSMPRKINFTIKALEAVKVQAGKDRVFVYDSHTPHLAFMRTDKGATAFYWYGRMEGRPVRYRIGDGTISIEQARTKAAGVVSQIADGKNPQADRQKARLEWTFNELFEWYIENHAKPKKRTWESDREQYEHHLGELASRRFTTIKRADIARIHANIGKKAPFAANRVLSLVSKVFNQSRILGYEGGNPAQGIAKFPEPQRERFMQAEELPRFFKALESVTQDWQDFFIIALLTGGRRSNVQSMEWKEINIESSTWAIPASKFKTNRLMTVHLVPEATTILKRRLSERPTDGTESPYVFPSYGKCGHLSEPKMAWKKICDEAKVDDFRLHDLRRTLGSWQAATGASLPIIGKSLGHTQQQTTQIYARMNLDPVRASVGTAVDAMMKAKNGEK